MRLERPDPAAALLGLRAMKTEKMFAALERGSQVNQDLSDKWDYWAYVELPSMRFAGASTSCRNSEPTAPGASSC